MTTVIGSVLSGGIQAGASVVGGVANTATLTAGGFAASGKMASEENGTEPLPPEDIRYVGQLVAQRTGLSQQEAEKRVTELYTRAQARLNGPQGQTSGAGSHG